MPLDLIVCIINLNLPVRKSLGTDYLAVASAQAMQALLTFGNAFQALEFSFRSCVFRVQGLRFPVSDFRFREGRFWI